MSATALDRLSYLHARLAEALDRNDLTQILAASSELGAAVDHLRAEPPHAADGPSRARASALAGALQTSQRRVNFLTDQIRRRADLLAARGARLKPAVYNRTAR